MGEMTPADVHAMLEGNDNFGGGAWWIIILFLFMMGNGGWSNWNNRGSEAYTQANALNDANFERLSNVVNNIENRQYEQANALTKGLADGFYGTIQAIGGVNTKIADCCCENRLATANLSAKIDQQTCAITNAVHAEGEATRNLIQQNEIQTLRDRLASVEMDNRMCGVVRYPNSWTYSANNPFCNYNNNGCGCGNV